MPNLLQLPNFHDSIKFENLSFVYPGRQAFVLKDLNLEIKQGEIIAVVGQSGVGKSTLVDLLPCFNKPTNGKITIDGTDINELDLYSLRNLIGIVSQDIILFNDTVRENIAFGNPGAAEAVIIAAAKYAYADEFIQELPQKYDTIIGDRGLKLSGGHRQRIAIARAILKNPPVLILDEATSSLDSLTEDEITETVKNLNLKTEHITIIIAHRLSTIMHSDTIHVLERGKIVESGNDNELLNEKGLYYAMWRQQIGERKKSDGITAQTEYTEFKVL